MVRPLASISRERTPVRVTEMPPSPLTQAQAVLGTLAAPLTALGMVIVLVFFMLLDRENRAVADNQRRLHAALYVGRARTPHLQAPLPAPRAPVPRTVGWPARRGGTR